MNLQSSTLFAAIAMVSIGLAGSASAEMGLVQANAETGQYRLELDVSSSEQMYSKSDAQRLKPVDGEIMVSGQMAGGTVGMQSMPGMSADANMQPDPTLRHLELHVLSKATGKAVRDAKVVITVAALPGNQQIAVPIAVMYGIEQGPQDWHYGNNVKLPGGHYAVQVSVNRDTAKFDLMVPAM